MGIRLTTAEELVGSGGTYIAYAVSMPTLEDKISDFPSDPWWKAFAGVVPDITKATVDTPDAEIGLAHRLWLADLTAELTKLPTGHPVIMALRANN